jgi:hypothetical protein
MDQLAALNSQVSEAMLKIDVLGAHTISDHETRLIPQRQFSLATFVRAQHPEIRRRTQ